ncbi:MAG: 23S rRNA (guanosine(2251)-2'-O)-methyltransferase RlmB [Aureispira sp.]|nr:23S rRNA (guanosine(2251)-2'-O)-methyltransferase RlmB [Aureispira sp.]
METKKQKKSVASNFIYGRHPVVDAIENGASLDKVMILQNIRGEFEKQVRKLCKEYVIPLHAVSKDRLNKITKKNHQGIIAYMAEVEYQQLDNVFPTIYDKGEMPLIMLLDGVTDVRNIGAIARSAEAIGAHAIVVPTKGSGLINAEAMKTSAGALSAIPVCRTTSLVTVIDYLQMNGVHVVAADLSGKKMLYELELTGPTAIVVGAEDRGVARHLLKMVDERFKIPMGGTTDSFNVSVASGIVLYEVLRQRSLA